MCYTRTSRGNRIATMFVKCSPNARFTILHSHGNAVDLGQMSSFYMGLGKSRLETNQHLSVRHCLFFKFFATLSVTIILHLLHLGSRINCNIFSYDYSGYGASSGKPSEKNLYADIDAAWNFLRTKYGISPENIILYGQSIGTVPTVDLASRLDNN